MKTELSNFCRHRKIFKI